VFSLLITAIDLYRPQVMYLYSATDRHVGLLGYRLTR